MLKRLRERFGSSDALVQTLRGSDDEKLAEVFVRSNVLFLQLPPGCENGLDPTLSQEELMAHLHAAAKDLSGREEFTPLHILRGNRRTLLLFTQQAFAEEFARAYVRQVNRIMPFGVINVKGQTAVKMFDGADAIVFNAGSKEECELSQEQLNTIRELIPQAKAASVGQA
jgi:hypothetical protein